MGEFGHWHECDATMEQGFMEDHLRRDHKQKVEKPTDVMSQFVLVRTALVGRGPGRRGKVDDETMQMFEFAEHRVNEKEKP